MITINEKHAVNISYMRFSTLTEFDGPFLINVLKGDNLYNSRAGSYKVNSNEYKNLLLNSLKKDLKSDENCDLLYMYADKHKIPESLCFLAIDENGFLRLRNLLIKRDDIRFLTEFVLIAKEIVQQLGDQNSIQFEVPVWNLKLKENLLKVADELKMKAEEIGSCEANLYKFEDKLNKENTETKFRDTVKIFRLSF